jgi:3-hydroxyacyl-CoA dehydrogenase
MLMDVTDEALEKGLSKIKGNYAATVAKGRLAQSDMDKRMGLIRGTINLGQVADADIVIEAVFERMDVKQELFRKLDGVMQQGAILATNTSTLDVDQIAAATSRPQEVIGTHFFSPANVMRLLEVVRGRKTDKGVLATTMKLGKALKKVPVVSGVCDGFIGNRMLEKYGQQSLFLLDEGATPQQVDKAIEKFGFAMGPFRMGDLAGNDIGWAIRKRRAQERPNMLYSRSADKLCELGRFGQKTGAGWYDYKEGKRDAIPSKLVEDMIVEHRKSLGITPRKISDEEIVQRLVFALVNEGARIVEEGIAARASDLDMVYITGYGFPIFRGGPMMYADQVGLFNVAQAMKRFAQNPHDDAKFWEPAPLLAKLAAEGKTFS